MGVISGATKNSHFLFCSVDVIGFVAVWQNTHTHTLTSLTRLGVGFVFLHVGKIGDCGDIRFTRMTHCCLAEHL